MVKIGENKKRKLGKTSKLYENGGHL